MRARYTKIRGWLVSLVSAGLMVGLGNSPLVKAQQNIVPGNAMTVRSDI
ncbi:MAG: ostA-like family protein, partial [Microcystis sp.]